MITVADHDSFRGTHMLILGARGPHAFSARVRNRHVTTTAETKAALTDAGEQAVQHC